MARYQIGPGGAHPNIPITTTSESEPAVVAPIDYGEEGGSYEFDHPAAEEEVDIVSGIH